MDELFRLLQEKTGVPPEEARLLHAGKELVQKQGKKISDYPSILHGSTLFMVMRLLGGEFITCAHTWKGGYHMEGGNLRGICRPPLGGPDIYALPPLLSTYMPPWQFSNETLM